MDNQLLLPADVSLNRTPATALPKGGPNNVPRLLTATLVMMLCLLCGVSMGQTSSSFNDGYITTFKVTSSAALTSTGTQIVLEEYIPTAAAQTSANFSNNLPAGSTGVVVSGSASSAGALSRSENGRYLVVPGYANNIGDANTLFTNTGTARLVNGGGTFSLGAPNAAYFTTANDLRGATSDDGSNFWFSGGSKGVVYTNGGAPVIVSTTTLNTRVVNIFNGQLFYSTSSAPTGIYKVGNGKPTTTGTTSVIQAAPSAPYGFSVSPDGLTIYSVGTSSTVVRYTYSGTYTSSTFTYTGGTWSAASTGFTLSSVTGVTVDWSGYTFSTGANGAVVYACNTTTLVKGNDNGTGAITTTTLRTLTGNNQFRGLAFSPTRSTVILGANTPATGNITTGSSNTPLFQFNLAANEGNSTIKKLILSQTGTATIGTGNSIGNFRLYSDPNGDGSIADGALLSTATVSGTTITFSGISQTYINQGSSNNYIVVGDVASSGTGTFVPSIASNKTLNSVNYTTNVVNAGVTAVNIGTTAPNGNTLTINPASFVVANQTGLTTFTAISGAASANGHFDLSSTALDGSTAVTITAPTNFEISTDGIIFFPSITFNAGTAPYIGGTLTSTTIFVRITGSASTGAVSGNVAITGGGVATTTNVGVSGLVSAAEPTTQANTIAFANVTATGFDINWTNGNGANRIVVVRATATTNVPPVDGTTYTANLAFGTVGTTTGAGNYLVYNNSGSAPITITGLTGCTDYTVEVYEYNGSGGGENYLTSTATGNPNNQTTLPASIANVTPVPTATGTSGQVSVNWANPFGCFDDIVIVAKAGTFTAALPTGGAFTVSSNNFTDGGNPAFDGGVVVYEGTSPPQVITGLTDGASYTFKTFTRLGTQWSTGVTASATPYRTLTFTEVVFPQYMEGNSSTNANRVPYAYRATIGGLNPNTTYRYINQAIVSTDGPTTAGAGNVIFANSSGSWVETSGPSLSTGPYGTLTTDASGNYTGWFVTEPTGNADFITGTANIKMRIRVNDGGTGTSVAGYATSTSTITALNLSTTAGTATGIYSLSSAQPKDFVMLYDNTAGTGRPLSGTFVESDGAIENSSYAAFYTTNVDGVNGAWGAITPNTNAAGVERIESRAFTTGNVLCFSTNVAGFTGTVNPTGGTAAIAVTGVPLNCSVVTLDQTNIPQVTAGTIATSTNDNIVSNFHIGVANGPSTLNSLIFNTGGTFNAGDVTNFKLYTSATNSFPDGTALSTVPATAIATGGTITFSSLAQTIAIGDQYYWITADLNASGNGNTIIVPALPNGDFTFAVTPNFAPNAITAAGTQTITTATPTIALASGTIAPGNIIQGTTNNVLYRADVTVSTVAASLTDVQFTTSGTYSASDLTNLKLWYSTSSTFSTGTASNIGTITSNLGTVTHDFASLTQTFPVGTGYLYVTTDAACANVPDQINVLGFAAGDFTFASGTPTGSGSNGGLQTFTNATPVNVTGVGGLGSTGQATTNWTNPTGCFNEVMIVASASAFTAAVPSGNAYVANSTSFTDGSNSTFDGGVVVYKGITSPQIITNLTNGTTYNFKIYTRNGNTWSTGVLTTAQPSLTFNPGDVQITGANGQGTDNFSFVTWVNIPAGTVLSFTDCGFINNGASANAPGNFRGTEGQLTWTAPAGGLNIGQVVNISSTGTVGPQAATIGTANLIVTNFSLNGTGDQLFVYTGPTQPTTNNSTFTGNIIYGITWGSNNTANGGAWLTPATASNLGASTSFLPSELASANVALSGNDDYDFTAPRNDETSFPPYKAELMVATNFTGSGPTPAITTSSVPFTLFSPGLIISEIMYDAPGTDTMEWVEIYNGGASTIDMFGYHLTNTTPVWNYTFPTHFNIVPGQYITVQAGGAGVFSFTPDFISSTASNQLSNTGSTISILDASSALVNTVTYNNTVLTAAAGNGASLEVTDVTLQNENFPINWQASAILAGSPGSINSTGVTTIYSRGSGLASTAAIWSSTPTGLAQTLSSLGGFASNRNVVIQTGNTVQISSGFNVENLTVQTGAKLWRNSNLVSALSYISVYGTAVQLDGTVGNGNTFDAIGLNIEGTTVTIQGNGAVNFARIRKSGNTNNTSNLVIDKNLGLTFVGTALYNNQGSAGTFNITVNAGSTVDFKGTGHVSVDGTDGINNSTRYGTFTIHGTLTNVDTVYVVTDNNNLGTTKLDIQSDGVVNANTVMIVTAVNGAVYPGGNTANITFNVAGKLNVFKALELQSGTFSPTGTVTLKSTSVTSVAILNNFSTNFTGSYGAGVNITAERFYASSLTYHQHEMGSPVNTPSLSQLGAASGTAGYVQNSTCDETKSDIGTPYGTVFTYDETHGTTCAIEQWKVLTSGTATNGVGYSVLKIGSGTVSLSGTPNLNSSYTVPVTNSGWSNTTLQGRAQLAGYALVSNPYPATLTISSATQTANEVAGFDGNVLVWNANGPSAGSYTIATTIAPFQSFLVHKTSAGGTANYTINATDRVTTATTFYKQVADNELNITATNNNTGLTDGVMVGFKADATTGFDAQYDAHKVAGALDRHTLYTVDKDGLWMLNNVLPSIQETNTIPMNFEPGATGSYTFTFDGINTFDATSYITLEDKQTNIFHDVRSGAYAFTADSADNWNRFVLHFTPAATINTTDASCTNQGMINVQQTGTANWNYSLTGNNNTVFSTGSLNANSTINTSVTAGLYTLTLTDNNGYAVVKNVEVKGAQPVTANFNIANAVQQGEEVNFTSNSQNATTNNWNFGDGSVATGNATTHTYTTEGVYTVTLTSANGAGCTSIASNTITVTRGITGVQNLDNSTVKIWSSENMVNVSFANTGEAVVNIYNIIGQQLVSDKLTSTNSIYNKAINNMEAGYVVVSVKSGTETTTKKVFIINNK